MQQLPDGFLWGAATAGHQVEGGNVNADIWPMEWAERSIFAEPSGDACDHYHRYPEDIATLADLGLTAYRFSLEWARIEPEPGYVSRAQLDHYRRVMATCLEHDVTPVVTLCHFTTPRWFAGRGGWAADDAAERFARYAAATTAHLGDLLGWVATLNEPNVLTLLEHTGVLPMGTGSRPLPPESESRPGGVGGHDPARYRNGLLGAGVERMAEVHRAAAEEIRSGAADARVGWTLALPDLQAAPGGEEAAARARQATELDWLDVAAADDWVGVQTYTRDRIGPDGVVPLPEGTPTHQTGWEIYPEALGHTVRLAAERAGVPVLVTENGVATDDDALRLATTRSALEGLVAAVADGVDVRGYLHWTLLDNFEWMAGYAKTFGLVAVDRTTFARTVKPSARWLGQVARANALT